MIPIPVKEGATALERWLLNHGRFRKALDIRSYRGIAAFDERSDEEAMKASREKYYKKVSDIVGTEGQMILDHIEDASDYDEIWSSLHDWMDDRPDYTAYEKMQQRREAWLNTLTVSDIHAMGYRSSAFLYSKTIPGRYGWDDQQEEVYKFSDGDEYREQDGRAYAVKLGIINEL